MTFQWNNKFAKIAIVCMHNVYRVTDRDIPAIDNIGYAYSSTMWIEVVMHHFLQMIKREREREKGREIWIMRSI